MEFVKKLLVLTILPTCMTLATGEEKKEISLVGKKLNRPNFEFNSCFRDSAYHKDLSDVLRRIKIQRATESGKKAKIDVSSLESVISEQAVKPGIARIRSLENEVRHLGDEIRHLEDYGYRNTKDNANFISRSYTKAMRRSFGFGAFAGLLATTAYSNFSKIRSYFNRTK